MKKILILSLITSHVLTKNTHELINEINQLKKIQLGLAYTQSVLSGILSTSLLFNTINLYKRTANKPRLALRIGFNPRFNIAHSSIWGLLSVIWFRLAKEIKENISGKY